MGRAGLDVARGLAEAVGRAGRAVGEGGEAGDGGEGPERAGGVLVAADAVERGRAGHAGRACLVREGARRALEAAVALRVGLVRAGRALGAGGGRGRREGARVAGRAGAAVEGRAGAGRAGGAQEVRDELAQVARDADAAGDVPAAQAEGKVRAGRAGAAVGQGVRVGRADEAARGRRARVGARGALDAGGALARLEGARSALGAGGRALGRGDRAPGAGGAVGRALGRLLGPGRAGRAELVARAREGARRAGGAQEVGRAQARVERAADVVGEGELGAARVARVEGVGADGPQVGLEKRVVAVRRDRGRDVQDEDAGARGEDVLLQGAARDALDAARAAGPASTDPSQQRLQLTQKRGAMPGGGPALGSPGRHTRCQDSKTSTSHASRGSCCRGFPSASLHPRITLSSWLRQGLIRLRSSSGHEICALDFLLLKTARRFFVPLVLQSRLLNSYLE